MMCLINIYGVRRRDVVRNSLITKRCGFKLSAVKRVESNALK